MMLERLSFAAILTAVGTLMYCVFWEYPAQGTTVRAGVVAAVGIRDSTGSITLITSSGDIYLWDGRGKSAAQSCGNVFDDK